MASFCNKILQLYFQKKWNLPGKNNWIPHWQKKLDPTKLVGAQAKSRCVKELAKKLDPTGSNFFCQAGNFFFQLFLKNRSIFDLQFLVFWFQNNEMGRPRTTGLDCNDNMLFWLLFYLQGNIFGKCYPRRQSGWNFSTRENRGRGIQKRIEKRPTRSGNRLKTHF